MILFNIKNKKIKNISHLKQRVNDFVIDLPTVCEKISDGN